MGGRLKHIRIQADLGLQTHLGRQTSKCKGKCRELVLTFRNKAASQCNVYGKINAHYFDHILKTKKIFVKERNPFSL